MTCRAKRLSMTDIDLRRSARTRHADSGTDQDRGAARERLGHDFEGRALFWIAVAFSAFQIVTAAFSPLPSQVRALGACRLPADRGVRRSPIHADRPARRRSSGYWAARRRSAFVLGLYHWVFYDDLILRAGDPSTTDIAVGVIVVVLVFEAARRMMGPVAADHLRDLPGLCAVRPVSAAPARPRAATTFGQIVDQMFLGTEGIYGTPTYVSSTYIFLFILFGAFLERAGMIQLFTDVAHGHGRPRARRPGQGRRDLVRPDGHDQRLRHRQRRDRRPIHDPADEALRLPAVFRRRGRGDRLDGRPDHAAGDGRGRLHHGRDHQRPLRRDLQGGDRSRRSSISRRSGWSISKPASAAWSACAKDECPSPLAALRRAGTCCCRWRCSSSCCSPATRRCSPAPSAWRSPPS